MDRVPLTTKFVVMEKENGLGANGFPVTYTSQKTDQTGQKLVQDYIHLPPLSCRSSDWRPCNASDIEMSERGNIDYHSFWDADDPRLWMFWQKKHEGRDGIRGKLSGGDGSRLDTQDRYAARYVPVVEELVVTLNPDLDDLPGAQQLDQTEKSKPPFSVEESTQRPELTLKLEGQTCQLQDDLAQLAQALLRSRDYEDDDDEVVLARLPSKNLPEEVVERLLQNSFFKRRRETSKSENFPMRALSSARKGISRLKMMTAVSLQMPSLWWFRNPLELRKG